MLDEANDQSAFVKLQNKTIHELRAQIDQFSKEANKLQNKSAEELGNAGCNFDKFHIQTVDKLRAKIAQ
jgi:hypothetical protein